MASTAANSTWSADDENRLLWALELNGLNNWIEVAKSLPGKTAQQAENHFRTTYPQEPTHQYIMLPEHIGLGIAGGLGSNQAPPIQGNVITARWFLRARTSRQVPAGATLQFGVPDSCTPQALKNYIDDKKYESEKSPSLEMIQSSSPYQCGPSREKHLRIQINPISLLPFS